MLNLKNFLEKNKLEHINIKKVNLEECYIASVSFETNNIIFKEEDSEFSKSHIKILGISKIDCLISSYENIDFNGMLIFINDIDEENLIKKLNLLCEKFKGTVIYIKSCTNENELYIRLLNEINQDSKYMHKLIYNYYIDLIDLLKRDNYKICDIGSMSYKILENPIVITDESYKLIYNTKNIKIDDPIWNTMVEKQYCPSEIVEIADYNGFWKRLNENRRPLFIDSTRFKGYARRAVSEIKLENKVKGYIVLMEINREIEERDIQILQFISEAIAVKINNENIVLKALGSLENEFVGDLLLGKMKNEVMAYNRSKSLGLNIGKYFSVLEVNLEEENKEIIKNIKQALSKNFKLCINSLNNNKAYFIVSFDSKEEFKKLVRNQIKEIMKNENAICAIGKIVDKITLINKSYEQAKQISEIVQITMMNSNEKSVYLYNEIAVYDMMSQLLKHNDYSQIKNSNLEILREIDKAEGTEYIVTLKNFFKNNQNITDTAKHMYLHRNTIRYRLKKISELIYDDFDNQLVRLHMNISFILYELNKDSYNKK